MLAVGGDSRSAPGPGRSPKEPERLHVRFDRSAPSLAACPAPAGPEIAFAGRSNAGKSSVLNRLTGSRQTAKVSKTPGRTQLLNFFAVNTGGYLVDLPGYGYARATRQAQNDWQAAVNDYLSHREALTAVVLVMDIRHPNQAFDRELVAWARASELPMLILLNKADKLGHGARQKALRLVRDAVADAALIRVLCFSAQTGLGLTETLAILQSWLTGNAS
jgi:GTP-binding protein